MPSAANAKCEKSTTTTTTAPANPLPGAPAATAIATATTATGPDNGLIDNGSGSPLRQAITVIEHKIRNLEKRKSKLESYKDLQKSGKELNGDQKTAVAKYDEVLQTLEFARDLYKQFLSIAVVSEKDEKKKARKEAVARSQAELNKVREIILIQDALSNMGQDTVREDFLNGRNGAAQLSQTDLSLLDEYYGVVTPKHEAGDPTVFMPQVQAAAEHLLAVVDGKNKEIFGSTYSNVKEVIGKIHESGYLDQAIEETYDEPAAASAALANETEPELPPTMVAAPIEVMEPQPVLTVVPPMHVAPLPLVEQPPQPQPPPPTMEVMPPMPPPGVQPVPPEQAIYYQQAPPPPQAGPGPINEVLGTGAFFFLQESELDTPPEQIASQTFTNQTYVGGPPPPIPMPQQFHQFAPPPPTSPPQQQQQPQQALRQQPPPAVQQQQQQVGPPPVSKNGYGDHQPDQHQDEVIRQQQQQHHRNNHQQRHHPQRSNITTHHHHQSHQTFFANNSSAYPSRPNNRNRNGSNNANGPRMNNNRQQHNQ